MFICLFQSFGLGQSFTGNLSGLSDSSWCATALGLDRGQVTAAVTQPSDTTSTPSAPLPLQTPELVQRGDDEESQQSSESAHDTQDTPEDV